MNYLFIFLGGGVGAVLRFILSSFIGEKIGNNFPWGTLAVNLTGAFLIGLMVEILALKYSASENIRYLIITGFLGGFTTFSAFSLESALILTKGEYINLAAYISLSILGTIFMVLLAIHIVRATI